MTDPPEVRQVAQASGEARINQAARDLHVHYPDGARRVVEPGGGAQECPYPGLASFGREQAQWFFGRDQLTARLDARLRTGGMQVVVAPSGTGKSSLLHAGLLPQLDRDALPGSSRWPRMVLTPTADPLATFATQIAVLIEADPATRLAEELAANPRQAGAILCDLIDEQDSEARVVVVVDQFEELFTLCPDDQQRRTFIESLAQLAGPPNLVVVGVRADFYAACADYPQLRAALQDNPLVVGPMLDPGLRAAILHPARDVGLDVEEGLVELLLRDLGDTAAGYEAGRLPLLAHALRATWQQRHGHVLTVDGYRATGGIHRAVATTADQVFDALAPAGRQVARPLFLRLIKIGDGTEDTRRRMSRADLLQGLDPGSVLPVLEAFTQSRPVAGPGGSGHCRWSSWPRRRCGPRWRSMTSGCSSGRCASAETGDSAGWVRTCPKTGPRRSSVAARWSTSTSWSGFITGWGCPLGGRGGR